MTLPGSAFRFRSIGELRQLARVVQRRAVADADGHVLQALDTDGRRLNAVADIVRKRALRAAKAVDGRRRSRSATSLGGSPYGVKDVFSTKGARTTWSAPPFRDQALEVDAPVVERLDEGGAVPAHPDLVAA